MMRSNKWLLALGLLAAVAMLAACGRTNTGSGPGDDSFVRPPVPDTHNPPPDGLRLPDGLPPPPPPPDFGPPPPPPDFGPPPPPPTDIMPPPPPPPDMGPWPYDSTPPPPPPPDTGPWPWDSTPPPPPPPDTGPWPWDTTPPPPPDMGKDTGPCVATCSQMCQVMIACGLYTKELNVCTKECLGWPTNQTNCLNKMICGGVSSCLTIGTCLAPTTLPDLVVKSFSAAVSKTTVTYKVQVCNQGKSAAGAFYLDLFYNRSTAPGPKTYGNKYTQIKAGLAAGACVSHTFTRNNTPVGTYSSWVSVDTDGYVKETNENNNYKGPVTVKVTGGPPPPKKPDLTIKSLNVSVYGTTVATVRYRFNVCNNGDTTSGSTDLHVYYNLKAAPKAGAKGDRSTSVPAIGAGNCVIRDIYRTWVSKGVYTSYGQVDVAGSVAESNENNNVFGPKTVTVNTTTPGADLKITSFSYQNYAFNTVLYNMRVCNVGKGSTAATQLRLYYNLSSAPKQGQSGNRTTTVPGLQAGGCTNRYITRTNTSSGTYYSYAYVDPSNNVKETNENNNVAGPIKVVINSNTKPDLYFKSFTATVSGKNVLYKARVCNKGTAAATPFRVDLYYNRSSAPTTQGGNRSGIVPTLNAGSCTNFNRTRTNVAFGTYKSWARVDRSNWVSEISESNNTAGPVTVTLSPPLTACQSLCKFAISCGLFTSSQTAQCDTWCKGLTGGAKTCAEAAAKASSCAALKNCKLPPPPPPPPPPGVCADICTWLVNSCKTIPSNQYWTCWGACQNLAASKIKCAQNAKAKKQCMSAMLCIL